MAEPQQVYYPEQVPVEESNGLYCFKDLHRPCNPSCMAYQTIVPTGPDYQRQQWSHCMILTNEHRAAKHLTIIAQGIGAIINNQQDKARTEQTAPRPSIPVPPGMPR